MNNKFQPIILEIQKSLRLSFPLIGSQMIYASSGIITIMMIANMGHNELAANVLVWGIYIALISISFGMLSAVSILVAHSYGANEKYNINITVGQGVILATLLAIPMIITIWFAPNVLYLTNQNPEVIKLSIPYFHSLAWCILPLNLLFVFEQFLIGISITRLVLFLSFLRVPVEIFLFYSMFFGKWGFPKLGLAGIGYGVTLSIIAALLVVLCYILCSKKIKRYKIFSKLFFLDRKYLLELIRVGWPLGSTYFIEMTLFSIVAIMIGQFGKEVLAAHQLAYQCLVFTLAIIFGISQGTTIRIGHEIGRKNKKKIMLALWVNIFIGFCFMLVVTLVYVFFPHKIISLGVNINDPKNGVLVKHAARFLLLAGVLQLTESIRLISTGALRALKDTRATMNITFITFLVVALPITYLLSFIFSLMAVGVWLGLIISLVIGSFVLLLRFRYVLKRVNLEKIVTK